MFKGYENAFLKQEGAGPAAGTAVSAPFLLSLPKIASQVPDCFTQATHASIVLLASQLGQVGVIKESDLVPKETIEGVIKKAIGRGIDEVLGEPTLFELSVDINDGEVQEYAELREEHEARPAGSRFHFTVDTGAIPTVFIGERILALEALCPGLGETVCAALQWAGYGSMLLFTFNHVFESIPFMYYFDERGEQGENGDDEEEDPNFEGLPTKETLLEGVPKWAGCPQLKLTPQQVEENINTVSTPDWAKEVLQSTLALAEAYKDGSHKLGEFSYSEHEPVYTLAVIRFSTEDQMGMILDDFFNMANNCSDNYTQSSHIELVYQDDTEAFGEWWKGILNGFKLVKSIETLLLQLSNGNYRHGC
jgi:PRTRC genetic system protein F